MVLLLVALAQVMTTHSYLPLFKPILNPLIRSRRIYQSFPTVFYDDDESLKHLKGKHSKIANFWIEQLLKVEKQSARELIGQLKPDNVLGYEGATGPAKKGSHRLLASYLLYDFFFEL